VNISPPACGQEGCVSHLAVGRPRCICSRWFDSGGTHLTEMNPACPEHVVESHLGIQRDRAVMEYTDRALGKSRDV
jgi:hypothetical protein